MSYRGVGLWNAFQIYKNVPVVWPTKKLFLSRTFHIFVRRGCESFVYEQDISRIYNLDEF